MYIIKAYESEVNNDNNSVDNKNEENDNKDNNKENKEDSSTPITRSAKRTRSSNLFKS